MSISSRAQIKVITINIEGDNHLERIIQFMKDKQPDVVCLQEVLAKDVDKIKSALGMAGLYVPFMKVNIPNTARLTLGTDVGLLLLTRLEILGLESEYYSGSSDHLPDFVEGDPNVANRAVITAEVAKDGDKFKIITTHFTWSAMGQTTTLQQENLDRLFTILDNKGEFILCGDFNAPRGKEIWGRLANKFTDNVPAEVVTTLDKSLHRVKDISDYVVDGMFSTKGYTNRSAEVAAGLSDHKAIVAVFEKVF